MKWKMRNEKNYDGNRKEALSVLESASFKVLKKKHLNRIWYLLLGT